MIKHSSGFKKKCSQNVFREQSAPGNLAYQSNGMFDCNETKHLNITSRREMLNALKRGFKTSEHDSGTTEIVKKPRKSVFETITLEIE